MERSKVLSKRPPEPETNQPEMSPTLLSSLIIPIIFFWGLVIVLICKKLV